MADTQALFPIYLARHKDETMTNEDYDNSVALNENNVNQNFNLLYESIMDLKSQLTRMNKE